MKYFFAEIKDNKIFALHESTSLDLIFRDSDGLLVELTEKEHRLLTACKGNIESAIITLNKVRSKIEDKFAMEL